MLLTEARMGQKLTFLKEKDIQKLVDQIYIFNSNYKRVIY